MSLYLKGTEYAILRSTDMLHWEITQQLTFETANECPDLRPISTPDGTENGFSILLPVNTLSAILTASALPTTAPANVLPIQNSLMPDKPIITHLTASY